MGVVIGDSVVQVVVVLTQVPKAVLGALVPQFRVPISMNCFLEGLAVPSTDEHRHTKLRIYSFCHCVSNHNVDQYDMPKIMHSPRCISCQQCTEIHVLGI